MDSPKHPSTPRPPDATRGAATTAEAMHATSDAPLFKHAAAKPGPSGGSGASVTVEGEVVRVTFENEDSSFRVLRVAVEGRGEPQTWVGVFPTTPPGTRVRATGRYEKDARHGDQLRVETLLSVVPSTIEGVERYLGSGMIRGIGPAYARRIVEAFGMDTLDVLDRAPERLAEVQGLGRSRALAVSQAWEKQRAIGAIMVFLQQHGATPALAVRVFKRFGPRAIDIVSRSPYRLALDVWGVGFKTADRIARSIGVLPDAPERAEAGVLQTLHDLTARGHVFVDRRALVELSAQMLGRDLEPVDAAGQALVDAGRVRAERLGNGEEAIYPLELHESEVRLSLRMLSLLGDAKAGGLSEATVTEAIQDYEARTGVILAGAQREAVLASARHKALIITGGPGVGKTTVVRAVLALFDRARIRVALAAPTGRAAKRMAEATGREASTLHRLLEFEPRERGFARKLGRPIEAGAIIVDEASMLDLALADALVQATADDARLILVGDVDQLPSVGPGAVLRDLIGSGVIPTVRLTQIFRQSEGSLIVKNAHRILSGIPPETATGPAGEFFVVERTTAESAADSILEVVTKRIPARFGLDPKADIQVLTPMHKGEAGSAALNLRLQRALNPEGPEVSSGARTLRAGDKVMQVRNDYDKEVYNGDVGFIESVDAENRTITVRFYDRDVLYEEGDFDELTLAYAVTIHKSQGSEYPAVVIPLLTQHFVMLSRNLLYTAVTRGKRLVVLVADPRASALALAETRREERRTWLAQRLRDRGAPC